MDGTSSRPIKGRDEIVASRIKGFIWVVCAAATAWVSVGALPVQDPNPLDTPAAADCTYQPAHKELYVARPDRARTHVAVRLKQASAALPETDSFFAPAPKNFIDNYIFDKMARDRISSANLSTDAEFLRRVYLDTTGRIPTADAVMGFLNDTALDKREKLIDSLLGTPEYADRWANFLGDRLSLVMASVQINLRPAARNAFHNFVRDSVGQNKPYDQFVKELITGSGDTTSSGAANFFVRWRQNNGPIQDTWDNLAVATGDMLGFSLECISCHDGAGHTNSLNLFLTDRTRYELWTLAAFFARTLNTNAQRDANNNVIGFTVVDNPTGSYILNTTTGNKTPRVGKVRNEAVPPKYLSDGSDSDGKGPNAGEAYRAALARMVASDHQLARATVNYVWKELFGLGLVQPANNFDLKRISPNAELPEGWTAQTIQPELLEALAIDFERHQYDLKYLIGTIMKSATYQLSSTYPGTWSDKYIPYYARKFPRRLKSEEIFDIITQATNRPASYRPNGYDNPLRWAMQLPDTEEPPDFATRRLLDFFLRGNREEKRRSDEGSISQALALMNDTFVTSRVKTGATGSTVATIFANRLTPSETVTQLYLTTLSRLPTADELRKTTAFLGSPVVASRLEVLQKTLLNKVDFIFNY